MMQEGAFENPEDPLIFAIKERVAQEVRLRIATEVTYMPGWNKDAQYAAAKVFMRPNDLSRDDFDFLMDSMDEAAAISMGKSLISVEASYGSDIYAGRKYIGDFLRRFDRLRDVPNFSIRGILKDTSFLRIIANTLDDPKEASSIYFKICRYSSYDKIDNEKNISEIHFRHLNEIGSLEFRGNLLDLWVKMENIISKDGMAFYNDYPSGNLDILQSYIEIKNYLESRVHATERLKKVYELVSERVGSYSRHLLHSLDRAPNEATKIFGMRTAKKTDPNFMPYMVSTVSKIIESGMKKDFMSELVTTITAKFLSGHQVDIAQKSRNDYMDMVAGVVDWQKLFGALTPKGKTNLFNTTVDSSHYAYLVKNKKQKHEILDINFNL